MLRDSQTLHAHPDWKGVRPAVIKSAWYEREIEIQASWSGRRIALRLEYLNSYAAAFLDGERAGEVRFPGELDLTGPAGPGRRTD